VRVPAGSIGIADRQTGIYPFAMPGGWRLIGQTGLPLFDPSRDPPATLSAGARVRFVAVDRDEQVDVAAPARPPEDGTTSHGVRGAIRVVEPGVQATVQDGGRWGYQRFGVPPGGAADALALAAGNLAVGNDPQAAAVEVTAGGAEFEFLASARFAVAGAQVDLTLRDGVVPTGPALDAAAGDRLRLGLARTGLRACLCIAGGIAVPEVLGSRSTYLPAAFGGYQGRALRPGDVLPIGPAMSRSGRSPESPDPGPARAAGRVTGRIELPFIPGGQWQQFPASARQAFVSRTWRISHRSDRIGLRLDGSPLAATGPGTAFVSDGTVTGAIQVSGDGLPIVLLVDRQTTGGYPKLGAVASVALHHLGQAQPGDEIVFRAIPIEEAERALREMRVQWSSRSS